MNKIIVTSGFIIACAFSGGAMAAPQSADNTTTAADTTVGTQPDTATNVAFGTRQVPAPGSRNCIRDTGSHITHRDGQACLPLPGNSYSREDLQRTGHQNVGRALQQLDPSVQVSGGGW